MTRDEFLKAVAKELGGPLSIRDGPLGEYVVDATLKVAAELVRERITRARNAGALEAGITALTIIHDDLDSLRSNKP